MSFFSTPSAPLSALVPDVGEIDTCRLPELGGGRRADSNRGHLHYESRPRVAASPLPSLQAVSASQNRGLGRTARSPWIP